MKNIRLQRSWIIRAPREEVYKILTNFENTPEYFPSVAKSAHIIERKGNRLSIEVEKKPFWEVRHIGFVWRQS